MLDFAWQYGRHNGGQVRLYEHNSTRFTPAYEMMGVPMWRVAHLSNIPYVLNVQWVGGGADNSAGQLELSRAVSRSIAGFVSSRVDEEWPVAFADVTSEDLEKEFPIRLSLQLFGGLYGNGLVSVTRGVEDVTTGREGC